MKPLLHLLSHDAVLPWGFFGILAVAAFWPVVFSGASAISQDIGGGVTRPYEGHVPDTFPVNDANAFAWQDEPLAELVSDELREGRLPLWNPHVGAGAPLAAALVSGALSPLHWPLFIHPSPLTWDIFVIARLILAAALTFYFCRLIGLGQPAALVGGALYGFSGYLVIFLQHYFIDGEVVLPGLLIAVELLLRQPKSLPRTALVAVALALLILAGNPQVTILNGLFVAGFAVVRLLTMGAGSVQRGSALGGLAAGAILGLLLSAFLLLPFLEFWRVAWHNHENLSIGENRLRISLVLSAFVPEFFGPIHRHWLRLSNNAFLPYAGFAVLILAPLSLARIKDGVLSATRWFFLGTGTFLALKVYGIDLLPLPGAEFPGSIAGLPAFEDTVWTKYVATLVFSAAILSAIGLDATLKRSQLSAQWLSALGAGAFLVLVAITIIHFRAQIEARSAGGVVSEALAVTGLLGATVIALLVLRQRGLLKPRFVALFVPLIIAADIAIWVPKDRWDRYDSLETVQPHVAFLLDKQETEQPFRFYGVDQVIQPVTAGAYGIYDLRNFDSLMVDNYRTYMTELVHKDIRLSLRLSTGNSDSTAVFRNTAVDAMNVRYIVIQESVAEEPRYRRLLERGGYDLVLDGQFQVYENPTALPRGYLVSRIVTVDSDQQAIELMRQGSFDPSERAVVHGAVPEQFASLETRRAGSPGSFVVDSYESQEVRGSAQAESPALLVFSDTHYPGWKAYVDGEEVDIERINLTMRGVFLEAGEHDVRFAYEPESVRYGLLISGTTALTLAGLLLYPLIRRNPPERFGQRAKADSF